MIHVKDASFLKRIEPERRPSFRSGQLQVLSCNGSGEGADKSVETVCRWVRSIRPSQRRR
jgi:hypothetical protein